MSYLPFNLLVCQEDKVKKYLLSLTHPQGRSKAIFFIKFGYSLERWELLALELRNQASKNLITEIRENDYGISYTVTGRIATPSGQSPVIRSVWFQENYDVIYHLVTAYPHRK